MTNEIFNPPTLSTSETQSIEHLDLLKMAYSGNKNCPSNTIQEKIAETLEKKLTSQEISSKILEVSQELKSKCIQIISELEYEKYEPWKTLLANDSTLTINKIQEDGIKTITNKIKQLTLQDSFKTLLSIVDGTMWNQDEDACKYMLNRIHPIIHSICTEKITPWLIQHFPENIQREIQGSRLITTASNTQGWALQFQGNDTERFLITNEDCFKIPSAYGYAYLDVDPQSGRPVARFIYENDEQRGFFDGTRLMSLPSFETCAPATAFSNAGYRVRVQRGNNAQCIINGYLYPNFQEEFDLLMRKASEFERYITGSTPNILGDGITPDLIAKKEKEAFEHIQIEENGILIIGEKRISPIGKFLDAPMRRNKNDFAVLQKSTFEKIH